MRLAIPVLVCFAATCSADGPPALSARDPEIEAVLRDVSEARIRSRIERLASFGTRHTLSETKSDTRGIGGARSWIKAEFDRMASASGGRLVVSMDSFLQPPGRRVKVETEIVNVVATLPGRRSPDRVIVIGGHYDSICSINSDSTSDAPGANDDASGTAVVLELAEILSRKDFDATIVFVAFAGEEQGLLGSTHFADEWAKAGRSIEAMMTNDIVGNTQGSGGRRDNRSVRVFSEGLPDPKTSPLSARLRAVGGENDGPSRQLARFVDETASLYHPRFRARPVFRSDRYLRGGDHMPFLAKNIAAVRFTEASENFERQHQDVRVKDGVEFGDVPSKVDFAYVADVARVNASVVATLALAPPPPGEATIETKAVENDTSLSWKAVPDADLSGYEVIWRETTAPFWEHALWVGDADASHSARPLEGRPPFRDSRRRQGRTSRPGELPPARAATGGEGLTSRLSSLDRSIDESPRLRPLRRARPGPLRPRHAAARAGAGPGPGQDDRLAGESVRPTRRPRALRRAAEAAVDPRLRRGRRRRQGRPRPPGMAREGEAGHGHQRRGGQLGRVRRDPGRVRPDPWRATSPTSRSPRSSSIRPRSLAMVRHVLAVPKGAWLLQTAAGSELGKMVIRLAKHDGIRTINVVRRREAMAELTSLGADVVICSADGPIDAQVRAIVGDEGVHHALDPVGGDSGTEAFNSLAADGMLVVYGTLTGEPIRVDSRRMIAGKRVIRGFWLGHWMKERSIPQSLILFREIAALMRSGVLTTEVGPSFGFDRIAEAVREAERPGRRGKVLLRP